MYTVLMAQGSTRQFLKCSRQRSSSRQPSRQSNLLRSETDQHRGEQDGQRHCRQQEECDEISNEVKIMLIKGFIEKNTQQPKPLERRSARRTALLFEQGCKYSHILMAVNQELLLDTKHVQEQCSEITLNMFGSVHKRHRQDHTPTTTQRVGALP